MSLLDDCIKYNRCEKLVQLYYNLIYHSVRKVYLAKRIPHTPDDIEDRLQEVFEKLYEKKMKKLRLYDPKFGLRLDGWIRLITTRTVLSHFRKRQEMLDNENFKIPIDDFVDEIAGKLEAPRLEARQRLKVVIDAVENLHPPYDLVLKLEWFHWLGPAEISEIIHRPVNEIYVIKSRAIAKLKKNLREIDRQI